MKRMTQWVLAAIMVFGASFFTACTSNDDNSVLSKQQEMEKSVVGLWYEEFEYKDVTENGKPFNRAFIITDMDNAGINYMMRYLLKMCLKTNGIVLPM